MSAVLLPTPPASQGPQPAGQGADTPAAWSARDDMLLLVDFKWLMSGLGFWIDMARLRADPAYAKDCIARGRNSRHLLLRRCARRLQARGLALASRPLS